MIEFAVIIAFAVIFLHALTWPGMILQKVPVWCWDLPVWIKKPLYSCPICMTPWWGSLILVVICLCVGSWFSLLAWLLIITTAGGINVVLSSIIHPHEQEPTNEG